VPSAPRFSRKVFEPPLHSDGPAGNHNGSVFATVDRTEPSRRGLIVGAHRPAVRNSHAWYARFNLAAAGHETDRTQVNAASTRPSRRLSFVPPILTRSLKYRRCERIVSAVAGASKLAWIVDASRLVGEGLPGIQLPHSGSPYVIPMTCKCPVRLRAHVLELVGIPRLYLIDIREDCRMPHRSRLRRPSPLKDERERRAI
jgi:hypothetical protein